MKVRHVIELAGHEARSLLRSPVGWVAVAAFLAVSGFGFWSVVQVLSDPQTAPAAGAVLATFLGQTMLGYVVIIAVLAAIGSRAIAEPRSRGALDALMAVPVADSSIIVGKWLGVWIVYALMWIVTLAFVGLFVVLLPAGQGLDVGPVVTGYGAVLLGGAALAALAVAVSSATMHPVGAFLGAVAVGLGWLLATEALSASYADLGATSATTRGVVEAIGLRSAVMAMCEGRVSLTSVVALVGIATTGLAVAHALLAVGRLAAAEVTARSIFAVLVAICFALLTVLGARHPRHWDATAAKEHSLAPQLVTKLAALEAPVTLHVLPPLDARFDMAFAVIGAVVDRVVAQQPLVEVRRIESAAGTDSGLGAVAAIVRTAGVSLDDLAQGGALILERAGRVRVLEAVAMAEYRRDALGVGHPSRFRVEAALANGLSELVDDAPLGVCVSAGHGEARPTDDNGWRVVWERALSERVTITEVAAPLFAVPAACDVLMLLGATRGFDPREIEAISAHLGRGRGLLVWWSDPLGEQLVDPGLRLLSRAIGVEVDEGYIDDPSHQLGVGDLWGSVDGDPDHAISRDFASRRVSVWLRPRPLRAVASDRLHVLVRAGDTAAVVGPDGSQSEAPAAIVAVARDADEHTGKIAVFGGGGALDHSGLAVGASADLVVRALAWLGGRDVESATSWKAPEYVRLNLSEGQRRTLFWGCVVIVPGLFAGLLAAMQWRRRRRG